LALALKDSFQYIWHIQKHPQTEFEKLKKKCYLSVPKILLGYFRRDQEYDKNLKQKANTYV